MTTGEGIPFLTQAVAINRREKRGKIKTCKNPNFSDEGRKKKRRAQNPFKGSTSEDDLKKDVTL